MDITNNIRFVMHLEWNAFEVFVYPIQLNDKLPMTNRILLNVEFKKYEFNMLCASQTAFSYKENTKNFSKK